jgi:hypothetical protein
MSAYSTLRAACANHRGCRACWPTRYETGAIGEVERIVFNADPKTDGNIRLMAMLLLKIYELEGALDRGNLA